MAAQVDGTEVAAVVIQGRGVWRARAHDRASFYPCGTQVSGTTCSMRAKCAGNAPDPRRPIFADGRVAATRSRYGRVDLASYDGTVLCSRGVLRCQSRRASTERRWGSRRFAGSATARWPDVAPGPRCRRGASASPRRRSAD